MAKLIEKIAKAEAAVVAAAASTASELQALPAAVTEEVQDVKEVAAAARSRVGMALARIEAEITMLEDTLHTFADHEKAAIAQYIGTLKTRLRAFVLRIGL